MPSRSFKIYFYSALLPLGDKMTSSGHTCSFFFLIVLSWTLTFNMSSAQQCMVYHAPGYQEKWQNLCFYRSAHTCWSVNKEHLIISTCLLLSAALLSPEQVALHVSFWQIFKPDALPDVTLREFMSLAGLEPAAFCLPGKYVNLFGRNEGVVDD